MIVEVNEYDNIRFSEKDCRNYISKLRRLQVGRKDVEVIQNYFVGMQKKNSQFYCIMDMDEKSRLRNVFWAYERCRDVSEYFGEFVNFNITYLANKYEIPIVHLIGVNNHGQSILLGCTLLSNEDTKTISLLFTKWLECMYGRNRMR